MSIIKPCLTLLCASTLTLGVSAQTKLRPGLWEIKAHMKTASGQMEAAMAQMQQQMAALPPEQRKQMEQMLGAQGISLPSADSGHKMKVCLTQEDVDLERLPTEKDCTQKVTRKSPNTLHMRFECQPEGDEISTGEGTITLDSPTAYSGQFQMKINTDGQAEQMDMRQQGRWLSADCGNIQPMR